MCYVIDEGAEEGTSNVDETSAQEEFEEKLKDCVEGLTQKRYDYYRTCV